MRLIFSITVSLMVLSSFTAQASGGCGGVSDYEKVEHLGRETIRGDFSCTELGPSYYYCSFRTNSQPREFFGGRTSFLPPRGQTLEITADIFKAIAWQDCDGSAVHGILKSFSMAGAEYQFFQAL